MPKVNSKQKGSRFERSICKFFTSWTGYEFNRVPASGGLRWKNAENITSDVSCTDKSHSRKFRFSIECKSYKELNFEHILLEKKSCKILHFWDQACKDAKRAGKLPILIMKYNGMTKGEAFVVVSCTVFSKCIEPQIDKLSHPRMIISFQNNNDICIIRLSDLKKINYGDFHREASKIVY